METEAKSGWPVTGQTEVSSSDSRVTQVTACGAGKVSSARIGVRMSRPRIVSSSLGPCSRGCICGAVYRPARPADLSVGGDRLADLSRLLLGLRRQVSDVLTGAVCLQ